MTPYFLLSFLSGISQASGLDVTPTHLSSPSPLRVLVPPSLPTHRHDKLLGMRCKTQSHLFSHTSGSQPWRSGCREPHSPFWPQGLQVFWILSCLHEALSPSSVSWTPDLNTRPTLNPVHVHLCVCGDGTGKDTEAGRPGVMSRLTQGVRSPP